MSDKIFVTINKSINRDGKEIFTEGKSYWYLWMSSTFQNHIIQPNEGRPLIFNEDDFYNNFKIKQ